MYFCSFIRCLILPRDSGSSGHLCLVGGAGAKPRAYLVPFLVSWGHRRISPLGYTLPLPSPSTTTWSCSSGHPLISCRCHYLPLSIFPSSHPTAACGGKLEAAFRGQPGLLDLLLSASHLRQASALVACTGLAVVCGRGKAQLKASLGLSVALFRPGPLFSTVSSSPGFPTCLLFLSQVHQLSLFSGNVQIWGSEKAASNVLVHQFENTEDFQKTRATDKCCAISRMKIHNKTFDIGKK